MNKSAVSTSFSLFPLKLGGGLASAVFFQFRRRGRLSLRHRREPCLFSKLFSPFPRHPIALKCPFPPQSFFQRKAVRNPFDPSQFFPRLVLFVSHLFAPTSCRPSIMRTSLQTRTPPFLPVFSDSSAGETSRDKAPGFFIRHKNLFGLVGKPPFLISLF